MAEPYYSNHFFATFSGELLNLNGCNHKFKNIVQNSINFTVSNNQHPNCDTGRHGQLCSETHHIKKAIKLTLYAYANVLY